MASSPHDLDAAEVLRATARRATRTDGSSPRRLSPFEAAQRNAAVFAHGSGSEWHWPLWLDRQTRPAHPAFVPRGDLALLENVTGRSFTTLGTVGAGPLAEIDPAGFVTLHRGQWGIDWLVRGDSRWYAPAHESGIRQRLVGDAPVVETAIRVGQGDIVQRVFCVAGERDAGDLVVIEIDNQTASPVGVALAIRPFDALGAGMIDALEFDGVRCRVNEQPAVLFPRTPSHYAIGSHELGDSVAVVTADAAAADPPRRLTCGRGLANAAAVFAVAHRTTLTVLIAPRAPRRSTPRAPERAIDAAGVGRGWAVHLRRAAAPAFVSDRHETAFGRALRRLLLTVEGSGLAAAPGLDPPGATAEARLVAALVRAGFARVVAPVLVARFQEQQLDAWARRDEPSLERNVAALDALGAHWTVTRDVAAAGACLASASRMLQWSARRLERGEGGAHWPALAWAAVRLAEIADDADQPAAAADLRALILLVRWHGQRALDHALVQAPPVEPVELSVTSPRGLELAHSAATIAACARAGDPRAGDALDELATRQSAIGAWPTVAHPRTGAGTAGSGDDPFVAAAFVEATLALTVDERLPADPQGSEPVEIDLLPTAAEAWRTRLIDVRNVPLASGLLSFSVRWHGPRPALLWELRAKGGPELPIRLRCPGLDPGFTTDQRSGEALLAEYGGGPGADPALGPPAVIS